MTDLEILESLPSLYPLKDYEEEAILNVCNSLREQDNPNSIRINFVGEEEVEEFKEYLKNQQLTVIPNQQPCEDCISREEAIKYFFRPYTKKENYLNTDILKVLRELPPVKPATVWHKIKTRPLTEEEKDEMYLDDNYYTFMYDCKMPNDEQKVLVKTQWGIDITTYYTDDGCYFEGYEDEGDVIAWMPLPEWKE